MHSLFQKNCFKIVLIGQKLQDSCKNATEKFHLTIAGRAVDFEVAIIASDYIKQI